MYATGIVHFVLRVLATFLHLIWASWKSATKGTVSARRDIGILDEGACKADVNSLFSRSKATTKLTVIAQPICAFVAEAIIKSVVPFLFRA